VAAGGVSGVSVVQKVGKLRRWIGVAIGNEGGRQILVVRGGQEGIGGME